MVNQGKVNHTTHRRMKTYIRRLIAEEEGIPDSVRRECASIVPSEKKTVKRLVAHPMLSSAFYALLHCQRTLHSHVNINADLRLGSFQIVLC